MRSAPILATVTIAVVAAKRDALRVGGAITRAVMAVRREAQTATGDMETAGETRPSSFMESERWQFQTPDGVIPRATTASQETACLGRLCRTLPFAR